MFTPANPHASCRGGGLTILYNEKWKVSEISIPEHTSFESIALQITGSIPATVYCPPKANSVFLHELSAFLTFLCSLSPNMILLGDFNIHIDNAVYLQDPYPGSCCSGVTPHNCTTFYLSILDHMLVSFNAQLPVLSIIYVVLSHSGTSTLMLRFL